MILSVAAAFALGSAVEKSGLAKAISESLASAAGGKSDAEPGRDLRRRTLLLTELISHSAAVSLIFPIAMNTAAALNVSYAPYVAAVTVAGSLGFATRSATRRT